jgi:2,4-dienoyl-CoA reductase-like NADH-dependent reductase (Old Yellow Enzyme family)
MVDMFTPGKLGTLRLDNRLIRSAVWMAMADESGFVTNPLVDCVRELAEGGVGLIILGYSYVQPNGRQKSTQTAIHGDEHIPGLRTLTDAVHGAGGRIAVQLVHAGPQTDSETIGGETPVAPSAVDSPGSDTPRALSTNEVWEIIEDFGQAARRSVQAGFDAVQIHGAHGYLVSRFISPLWNVRDDEFGGSLENRMRFALEVYRSVRKHAADLPVFIKLNLDDFVDGSTTPDDALPLAAALSAAGIDAIEVSGGGRRAKGGAPARTGIKKREDEGYLMDLVRMTRRETDCAIIAMGGFRSPDVVDAVLSAGDADFVSMARPFIREPGLVNRWRGGNLSRAACESCNGCYKSIEYGDGIQCWVDLQNRLKGRD